MIKQVFPKDFELIKTRKFVASISNKLNLCNALVLTFQHLFY